MRQKSTNTSTRETLQRLDAEEVNQELHLFLGLKIGSPFILAYPEKPSRDGHFEMESFAHKAYSSETSRG